MKTMEDRNSVGGIVGDTGGRHTRALAKRCIVLTEENRVRNFGGGTSQPKLRRLIHIEKNNVSNTKRRRIFAGEGSCSLRGMQEVRALNSVMKARPTSCGDCHKSCCALLYLIKVTNCSWWLASPREHKDTRLSVVPPLWRRSFYLALTQKVCTVSDGGDCAVTESIAPSAPLPAADAAQSRAGLCARTMASSSAKGRRGACIMITAQAHQRVSWRAYNSPDTCYLLYAI